MRKIKIKKILKKK